MIIDASVILRAFFPDESQEQAQAVIRDHVAGKIALKAPNLLPYEVSNAVWQAERRGRIGTGKTGEIISSVEGLDIEILAFDWGEMLPMARKFERSAYDAAYLTLAEKLGETLITGDERLYNAVKDHSDFVLWVDEYP